MTGKLRLVGVQVRPEFVIDDGETLTPVVTNQPLGQYVSAKDWPDYPTTGFLEATQALEKELAKGTVAEGEGQVYIAGYMQRNK